MSERHIWTLNRCVLGLNGAMITTPVKHFDSQMACEDARLQADQAFQLFFSGILMVQGKPVMEAMGLLAQMCLQGIGHTISEGDVHSAALLEPVGTNGPPPKIFIPGVQ